MTPFYVSDPAELKIPKSGGEASESVGSTRTKGVYGSRRIADARGRRSI
jgi:hypothetical protein